DLVEDAVSGPTVLELFRLDEYVALVGSMHRTFRHMRHAQAGQRLGRTPYLLGVGHSARVPLRHAAQLNAADRRLDLDHPPVGAEAFVQPAESRRVLALVDSLPALAVILERPHARPQLGRVG